MGKLSLTVPDSSSFPMNNQSVSDLQHLYQTSTMGVRAGSFPDMNAACGYYERYVSFVCECAPSIGGKALLEVGCGEGWAAHCLHQSAYDVTALDLNPQAFVATSGPVKFLAGSALALPFRDQTFDIVTMYQTLEHVPDPVHALQELVRVCKVDGTIVIVGPNLISLAHSVRAVYRAINDRAWNREPGLAVHPFGNTVPETLKSLFVNSWRTTERLFTHHASFLMREPDINPPFHADNDSCNLCNPMDVSRCLTASGCNVFRNGAYGRPEILSPFFGGTWIAARRLSCK